MSLYSLYINHFSQSILKALYFIFNVYVSSSITRISSIISNHCLQFKVMSLSQFLVIVFLHATRRILHKYWSLLGTMPLIFPIRKNKEVLGILYPSTSDITTCTSSQKDWIFSQLQKICAWSASNCPHCLQQTCCMETCLLLILGVIKNIKTNLISLFYNFALKCIARSPERMEWWSQMEITSVKWPLHVPFAKGLLEGPFVKGFSCSL